MRRVHPDYLAGARAAIPFAVAGFLIGVSFGVLAQSVGLSVLETTIMSGTVFAGAAQFAAVTLAAAGSSLGAALVAAGLLNARFVPMGIAMARAFSGSALRRAAQGQALVDASWALANEGEGRFNRRTLIGATLAQYPCWVSGSALGAVAGDVVGDTDRFGLDALFAAFFLALLAEELRGRRSVAIALTAAAIVVLLIPLTPAGIPVLASSAAALIVLKR